MADTKTNELKAANPAVDVAALLEHPNPWWDWAGPNVPRLGSMRLAALLLRDVPVSAMVNALAPALDEASLAFEQHIVRAIKSGDLREVEFITFTEWLEEQWKLAPSFSKRAVEAALPQIGRSPEAALFTSIVEDPVGYNSESLLWLLMNAIQAWSEHHVDDPAIDPAARWLVTLEPCGGQDGLATLYGHLYRRFAAAGHIECDPLPLELETRTLDEYELYQNEVGPAGSAMQEDGTLRINFDTSKPLLPQLLGSDSRMWCERATIFEAVRRQHHGQSAMTEGSGGSKRGSVH